ncbi:MAG: hypothetical protein KA508_07060 [Gammaproteobacteria bacterium]|nr:hypothetical protein [Gammaproteobacteria bacterium]
MRNQDEAWILKIIEVHDCMSKEITRQLNLTAKRFEQRRAVLSILLNELDGMDSLIDCAEPSLENYQWVCGEFFAWLDHEHLQLGSLMIEKIQKTFGRDHFFVKEILPKIKKGGYSC